MHCLYTLNAIYLRDIKFSAAFQPLCRWTHSWVLWAELLPHAVSCRRFCFWHHQRFFLFVYEIFRGNSEEICTKFTRKTCLVPCLDEFEGQGYQGQKRHFLPLCWPACGLCLVKHLSKPLVWLLFVEIVIPLQVDVYVTQMTLSFVWFWTS